MRPLLLKSEFMKKNQLLIILVLLLITVVVWIGGNVYHNLNKSTISEATSQEIIPIDPTFNTQIIEKLKKRVRVNPNFELVNVPTSAPSKESVSSPSSNLSTKPASNEGKILP